MTTTLTRPGRAAPAAYRGGTTIDHWDPEDEHFWDATGRTVARRNLVWSIFSEHLGFSVWLLWSVSAALLPKAGFAFTVSQLFLLVAIPNLVGALIRLPYTFAVPRFGGRSWTVVSALGLLVPTLLFAWAVQHPGTPYWVFCLVAATAGLGGGNFASSMANINFFYPTRRKGTALGLNAAGGNLGVAVIQLFLPVVVGGAGLFGLVQASAGGVHLERAGYLYAALAVVAALAAWRWMNNLSGARSSPREQLRVVRHPHTWVMSFLYIGTFGSFIGYSAAMPLLIRLHFWSQPVPAVEGIGIDFVHYAFLGALVGSVARPLGGWLADRYGGARVTVWTFVAMIVGTLGVVGTLLRLRPVPEPSVTDAASFAYPDATVAAVEANAQLFPWFLASFLFVFAASGIGNGSTYRMIPLILTNEARRNATPETAGAALAKATKESSAVIGIAGAIGALGGFLIPMTFGAPWIEDPVSAVKVAFGVFTGFYVICLTTTWFVYVRTVSFAGRAPSLAGANI
ncbi:MAG TPA: nitrate/nitrite transporter [Nocardioides sp.]